MCVISERDGELLNAVLKVVLKLHLPLSNYGGAARWMLHLWPHISFPFTIEKIIYLCLCLWGRNPDELCQIGHNYQLNILLFCFGSSLLSMLGEIPIVEKAFLNSPLQKQDMNILPRLQAYCLFCPWEEIKIKVCNSCLASDKAPSKEKNIYVPRKCCILDLALHFNFESKLHVYTKCAA